MTEPYKPWEGKHFKDFEHFANLTYAEDDSQSEVLQSYCDGCKATLYRIKKSLKKDWDEQGRDV